MNSFWKRITALGRADRIHSEMEEEFTFHVDRKADDLIKSGVPEAEARRMAAELFGHRGVLREEGIATRGAGALEDWWNDLRFSFRLLTRFRARTAVLIGTLTLGIALSAAMFGVLRAVVLQPLPFDEVGQLAVLHQANGHARGGVSYPHYRDWKAAAKVFSGMAVFSSGESTITTSAGAERVTSATVSANLFSVLHVAPLRGRLFRAQEDRLGGGEGGERPALISESYWRSRMGAREDVVGQHITIDGFSFRIAGVIPARLAFPISTRPVTFWTTVAVDAEPFLYGGSIPEARGYPRYDGVIARLQPHATPLAAAAEMKRVAASVAKANPGATSMNDVSIQPALEDLVGDTRSFLLLLFGAVIAVLLVSCANASTLLLVTALSRRREFGIRAALGAQPIRLFRQVILENACIGVIGGLLALPLSWGLVQLCVSLAPAGTPRITDVHVDAAVFFYALAVSLAVGLLVGCLPALFSMRRDVQSDLSDSGRSSSQGRGSVRAGALLISAQIAACMVLTCGAAVLANSFLRVLNTPRGFEPHAVITASIDLPVMQYPQRSDKVRNYYRSLVAELAAQPNIAAVSIAERLPLSGSKNSTTFQVAGRETAELKSTDLRFVDQHYFATLKIPVVSGRAFSAGDDASHLPVALVNGAFARRFLRGETAEGRLLKLGWGGSAPKKIIGVVADLKSQALDLAAPPEVYVPASQFPNNGMALLIRANAPMNDVAGTLRRAAARVDVGVPVDRIRTLDEYLVLSLATQRFLLSIMMVFALSTTAIAAIGLYGLLSYAIERRTREFGIRMALGSRPAQLLRMVLRQGLLLAVGGIALGILISLSTTRLLSEWLYETQPGDWDTLVFPALILLLAALAASFVPARRASRTDPLLAIRAE